MNYNLTEFEKAVLKQAYNIGMRYVASSHNQKMVVFCNLKPGFLDYNYDDELKIQYLTPFNSFGFLKNKLFKIEDLLGIFDWSKVKKDTLVLIMDEKGKQQYRYFHKYNTETKEVEVYPWGTTSLTCPKENVIMEKYKEFEIIIEGNKRCE